MIRIVQNRTETTTGPRLGNCDDKELIDSLCLKYTTMARLRKKKKARRKRLKKLEEARANASHSENADADDAQLSDRTVCATTTADISTDNAPTALDARLNEQSMERVENASAPTRPTPQSTPAATSSNDLSAAARQALEAARSPAAEEFIQQMTFANQHDR